MIIQFLSLKYKTFGQCTLLFSTHNHNLSLEGILCKNRNKSFCAMATKRKIKFNKKTCEGLYTISEFGMSGTISACKGNLTDTYNLSNKTLHNN